MYIMSCPSHKSNDNETHNSSYELKHELNIVTALLEFERKDRNTEAVLRKGKVFMYDSLQKDVFNLTLNKFPTNFSETRSRNKKQNNPDEKFARLITNKGTVETSYINESPFLSCSGKPNAPLLGYEKRNNDRKDK
jgi:hypothetical protein